MPSWANVVEVWNFWKEVFVRAFWDSLLFFFETRQGAWKGIALILLGMAVTTLIVWIARNREALTEHLRANIAIVIAGGVATWLLVFVCYVISEPFMQHQALSSQLSISAERERVAVIGRNTAELQIDEVSKQRTVIFQQLQEIADLSKRPKSCPKCGATGGNIPQDIQCQELANCPSAELSKRAEELIDKLQAIVAPYDAYVRKWENVLDNEQRGSAAYNELLSKMGPSVHAEGAIVIGQYRYLHRDVLAMREALIKRLGKHEERGPSEYQRVGEGNGNAIMVESIISDLSTLNAGVRNLRQH